MSFHRIDGKLHSEVAELTGNQEISRFSHWNFMPGMKSTVGDGRNWSSENYKGFPIETF